MAFTAKLGKLGRFTVSEVNFFINEIKKLAVF